MYCHIESFSIVFETVIPLQNDDEEGGGDFETEDTIVCQWEKVCSHSAHNICIILL